MVGPGSVSGAILDFTTASAEVDVQAEWWVEVFGGQHGKAIARVQRERGC